MAHGKMVAMHNIRAIAKSVALGCPAATEAAAGDRTSDIEPHAVKIAKWVMAGI
jgi:hypothetical protein